MSFLLFIFLIIIPKQYLNSAKFTAGEKILSPDELPLEFMLNALRLHEAIPIQLFEERTGVSFNNTLKKFRQAEELGLLNIGEEVLATTPFGKRFLNDCYRFYPLWEKARAYFNTYKSIA